MMKGTGYSLVWFYDSGETMTRDWVFMGRTYRQGELLAITLTGYGYCTATVKATGEEVKVKPKFWGWGELRPYVDEKGASRRRWLAKQQGGSHAEGNDLPR